MNRSTSLFRSLVGSSIDYSFKRSLPDILTIDKVIVTEKKQIEKNCEEALSTGGELCVMLLGELTYYYSKQTYYMAVRSSIRMRRFRSLVLDYLKLSVNDRARRITKIIEVHDKYREVRLEILRYFLKTYPSRANYFRSFLSREEFRSIL